MPSRVDEQILKHFLTSVGRLGYHFVLQNLFGGYVQENNPLRTMFLAYIENFRQHVQRNKAKYALSTTQVHQYVQDNIARTFSDLASLNKDHIVVALQKFSSDEYKQRVENVDDLVILSEVECQRFAENILRENKRHYAVMHHALPSVLAYAQWGVLGPETIEALEQKNAELFEYDDDETVKDPFLPWLDAYITSPEWATYIKIEDIAPRFSRDRFVEYTQEQYEYGKPLLTFLPQAYCRHFFRRLLQIGLAKDFVIDAPHYLTQLDKQLSDFALTGKPLEQMDPSLREAVEAFKRPFYDNDPLWKDAPLITEYELRDMRLSRLVSHLASSFEKSTVRSLLLTDIKTLGDVKAYEKTIINPHGAAALKRMVVAGRSDDKVARGMIEGFTDRFETLPSVIQQESLVLRRKYDRLYDLRQHLEDTLYGRMEQAEQKDKARLQWLIRRADEQLKEIMALLLICREELGYIQQIMRAERDLEKLETGYRQIRPHDAAYDTTTGRYGTPENKRVHTQLISEQAACDPAAIRALIDKVDVNTVVAGSFEKPPEQSFAEFRSDLLFQPSITTFRGEQPGSHFSIVDDNRSAWLVDTPQDLMGMVRAGRNLALRLAENYTHDEANPKRTMYLSAGGSETSMKTIVAAYLTLRKMQREGTLPRSVNIVANIQNRPSEETFNKVKRAFTPEIKAALRGMQSDLEPAGTKKQRLSDVRESIKEVMKMADRTEPTEAPKPPTRSR